MNLQVFNMQIGLKEVLALINTVILGVICWFVYDYLESAKAVNEAVVTQIESVPDRLISPIEKTIITPMSDAAVQFQSLANQISPELTELKARAKYNSEFASFVLAEIKKADADIYSSADSENRERASVWVMRAQYEVKVISWVAWNERDVIHRLSVKDTSFRPLNIIRDKNTDWLIEEKGKTPIPLYRWITNNSAVLQRLEKLDTSHLERSLQRGEE